MAAKKAGAQARAEAQAPQGPAQLPALTIPCVQVAIDFTDESATLRVCELLARETGMILEAGTPLIKKCGIGIVRKMKQASGNKFVVADLKTLDVGALEVQIAKEGGADAAVVSGLAGAATINPFLSECKRVGIVSYIDMMNVRDSIGLLRQLNHLPDVVLFHRGIDSEGAGADHALENLPRVKSEFPGLKFAVAGGLNEKTAKIALHEGADIVIVGRFVTGVQNPAAAVRLISESLER